MCSSENQIEGEGEVRSAPPVYVEVDMPPRDVNDLDCKTRVSMMFLGLGCVAFSLLFVSLFLNCVAPRHEANDGPSNSTESINTHILHGMRFSTTMLSDNNSITHHNGTSVKNDQGPTCPPRVWIFSVFGIGTGLLILSCCIKPYTLEYRRK